LESSGADAARCWWRSVRRASAVINEAWTENHITTAASLLHHTLAAALGVLEEGGERQPRGSMTYVGMRRRGIFSTGVV
jgi:hypothetical protein